MLQIDPIKLLVVLIDGQTVTLDEVTQPKDAEPHVGIVGQQNTGFKSISQTMKPLVATHVKECREAAKFTMRKTAMLLGISHTY
ncbi:MAG: hypothetical protein MJK04_08015, partial [Psychrosphaera sp.]|nr:hypothetical protein [Psychrosphaera sp.]